MYLCVYVDGRFLYICTGPAERARGVAWPLQSGPSGFRNPPTIPLYRGVWVVGDVFWVCLGVLGRWFVQFMVFWFRLGIPKGDGAWEVWAWTW